MILPGQNALGHAVDTSSREGGADSCVATDDNDPAAIVHFLGGCLVGCELAIAAFVHPTLDKLPDDVHLLAASALARVLGSFMPFWYILVFLLTLAEVVIQWHQSGRLPIWIATSAVLWMLASLYSVTALVPINNRIKSTPPPDWKTYRRRWDLLHRRRVVLLTIAFAFLIVGVGSK